MIQTLIFDKMIEKGMVYSYYFSRDNENELDNYFIMPNDIIIRQMDAEKCYVIIDERDFSLIRRVCSDVLDEDGENDLFND